MHADYGFLVYTLNLAAGSKFILLVEVGQIVANSPSSLETVTPARMGCSLLSFWQSLHVTEGSSLPSCITQLEIP